MPAKKVARKGARKRTKSAGSAKRKTAVRRKTARTGKKGLSKKQVAQRRYAGSMSGLRKRASKAAGGKGRVAKRKPATTLRKRLGLKGGK